MVRRILPALLSLILLPLLATALHAQYDTTLPEIPADTSRKTQPVLSADTLMSAAPVGTLISVDTLMRVARPMWGDTLLIRDTTASQSSAPVQQSFISSPAESASPLTPQKNIRSTRLGFYAAGDYTFQEAAIHFDGIQGGPSGDDCHCTFDKGEGFGFVGGLSLSLGFNNDRWWQTTRITYASRTARASFSERVLIYKPPPQTPEFEESVEEFDLGFQMLNTEVLFGYALGSKGFFATGGISVGYLVGNSYSVTLSVAEVEYKPTSGKLEPVQKFTTSLLGGGGMRIRLGQSGTMIQPEVLFTYPLEEISRKYRWDFTSLRAGVTMLIGL
jgi:hypothetical protein